MQISGAQEGGAPEDKNKELAAIREQIAQLKLNHDKRARERDKLAADLREAEEAIVQQRLLVADLAGQRDQQKKKKAQINRRLVAQEKILQADIEELEAHIVSLYTGGTQERIKLLLTEQDPATLGRLLTYYRYISEFRSGSIEVVNNNIAELVELKGAESIVESKLAALTESQMDHLSKLDIAQKSRERLLVSLKQDITEVGSKIRKLNEQEKNLAEIIRELTMVVSNYGIRTDTAFSDLLGHLVWPVTGRLKHDFGKPRAGRNVKWNGIVVSAPRGRAIRAAHQGLVVFADWLVGMGLLIIIDHGEGYMTLYGYNETTIKVAGDWVDTGDVIGTVGDTGGQQETGLYFEIRHQTKPLSPRRWFGGPLQAE
ncbi:MAG: non-catalytic member of peptidase subfamily M23B [Gammaproteobacteria bacterium]|nr:MAG: non-catalytic member of peptidase subfamily M23B [Gammaproteobacteria bacterium]